VFAAGCAQRDELMAVEVVNRSHCEGVRAGLEVVSYAKVASLGGSKLITMTRPAAATEPELVLLLVAKGRQKTPGHVFSLRNAALEDGVAVVEFEWQAVDSKSGEGPAVHHPCIVVGLQRGAFEVVRARDTNGTVLGEVRI
jgi:hypothetical protein